MERGEDTKAWLTRQVSDYLRAFGSGTKKDIESHVRRNFPGVRFTQSDLTAALNKGFEKCASNRPNDPAPRWYPRWSEPHERARGQLLTAADESYVGEEVQAAPLTPTQSRHLPPADIDLIEDDDADSVAATNPIYQAEIARNRQERKARQSMRARAGTDAFAGARSAAGLRRGLSPAHSMQKHSDTTLGIIASQVIPYVDSE